MTSQPLLASVCVDYLSHPFSAEDLMVCYQQITRQIAHAPQSAKDAAISYQHQSQTLLELLQQHQNLAIPSTKERPAPVGCRSQLKRMQNALWRRSSQSSLAKDVELVHPETLNWQKECDVLWLYGPLYEIEFLKNQKKHRKHQRKSSYQREWQKCMDDNLESESLHQLNCATTTTTTTTTSTKSQTESQKSPFEEKTIATLTEPSESNVDTKIVQSLLQAIPNGVQETVSETSLSPSVSQLAISMPDDEISSPSHLVPRPDTTSEIDTLSRPTKSALKQLGTRDQIFEELRAYTHSQQYIALSSFLLTIPEERMSTEFSCIDGSYSEPSTPCLDGNGSAYLPIFPTPTKYHFRSHDRRRSSFPKSSSHLNRLNVNINVGSNIHSETTDNEDSLSILVPGKQLRFSLEVQELVFLPTSPPFRISRAKPTRAHSDPAIQSSSCSSFIAPSFVHSSLPSSYHDHRHNGSLISTSAASHENSTTTFIKVHAHDGRSSVKGSSNNDADDEDDENRLEYDFNDDYHDEYFFDDCVDSDTDQDEDDEFNGLGSRRRYRLATKNAIIARRTPLDERQNVHPGVLWKVYTAVTGVRELIAWYGSMVYHSSSL
ncbi:hypothetical protein BGZ76_002813 [Entomortierella beljakovae]|nr:hypothetical protein BGZ76_002813 [Entomortierella beljakovae]